MLRITPLSHSIKHIFSKFCNYSKGVFTVSNGGLFSINRSLIERIEAQKTRIQFSFLPFSSIEFAENIKNEKDTDLLLTGYYTVEDTFCLLQIFKTVLKQDTESSLINVLSTLRRSKDLSEYIQISVYAFLYHTTYRIESHPIIRIKLAKSVVFTAERAYLNCNSEKEKSYVLEQACTLLYKCNLKKSSIDLKYLLFKLDTISEGAASKYYQNVDLDKDLDQIELEEDPFFTDKECTEDSEENYEELSIQGIIAIEEIERMHAAGEEIPDIENLAKESLFAVLRFIDEAESAQEVLTILEEYCGPNGTLHKCKISEKTLYEILSILDKKTNSKASKIYYSNK